MNPQITQPAGDPIAALQQKYGITPQASPSTPDRLAAFKAGLPSAPIQPLSGGIPGLPNINGINAVKTAGTSLAKTASDTLQQGRDIAERQMTGKQGLGDTALQTLGLGANAAGKAVFGTAFDVLKSILPSDVKNTLKSGISAVGGAIKPTIDAVTQSKVGQALADHFQKNPNEAQDAKAMFDILSTFYGGGAAEKGATLAKPLAEDAVTGTKNLAEQGMNTIKQGTKEFLGTTPEQIASKDLNNLQEMISPKITSKETQAIIKEGRLSRGNESIVFGKQPDIVTQSEAVQRAAKTIQEAIPNAAKMTDAELVPAIDQHITDTAKMLQGDMKAVPVKLETTGKVQDTWKALKETQQSTPEFLDNKAGNTAFQKQFENHLKQLEWDITDASGQFKKPTSKTLDDIWEARKSYDDSIPANVKNATENSSPILQGRKTMWLQNRAILNSAINDNVAGLGNESKKAFAQMSDMYDAKQNILSKAKIDTTGTPGLLPSNKKQLLKWGVGAGATLIGGDILLRKLIP